jgi:hypothetical protein
MELPSRASSPPRRRAAMSAHLPSRRPQAGPYAGPIRTHGRGRARRPARSAMARAARRSACLRPFRLTLPRAVWLAGAMGLCAWQIAAGHPAAALLAVCVCSRWSCWCVVPIRCGWPPGWRPRSRSPDSQTPSPALAGQACPLASRAAGSAGLLVAAPRRAAAGKPVERHGRACLRLPWQNLDCRSAPGRVGSPPRCLPWIVRGHNALLDTMAAILWATSPPSPCCWPSPWRIESLRSPGPLHAMPSPAPPPARLAVVARALRGPS